jgi:hypothetical protein
VLCLHLRCRHKEVVVVVVVVVVLVWAAGAGGGAGVAGVVCAGVGCGALAPVVGAIKSKGPTSTATKQLMEQRHDHSREGQAPGMENRASHRLHMKACLLGPYLQSGPWSNGTHVTGGWSCCTLF